MTQYFPIFTNLNDKPCLVVGAGAVARGKIEGLLHAGAMVTVIAPWACDAVSDWAQQGRLIWLNRSFKPGDTAERFLVIAATDSPAVNHQVFREAEDAHTLVNVVDDTPYCNFIMASVAQSGPVKVAVSTSGTSPTLARRLRQSIEASLLGPEVGVLAEFLGSWRARVNPLLHDWHAKCRFWDGIFSSAIPALLEDGQAEKAAEVMAAMVAELDHSADQDEEVKLPVASAPSLPLAEEVPKAADPQMAGLREKQQSVYLVGAGPGAADLITVRGRQVLERADVVLYDRLANPALLALLPLGAKRVYVGKERNGAAQFCQARIHALMIRHWREGKLVVRLKGGDPFVFGRGGEEVQSLREAKIPVEVVPGISSCVSAPMSAGIPVTFRGIASSFGVFTGHPGDAGQTVPTDWTAAARMDTAIFLMGVARLKYIVAQLLEHGRDPATPVAMIQRATLPGQQVIRATLATIVGASVGVRPPATLIVGKVAALSDVPLQQVVDTNQESFDRLECVS